MNTRFLSCWVMTRWRWTDLLRPGNAARRPVMLARPPGNAWPQVSPRCAGGRRRPASYGINTGFGAFANTRISTRKLTQLQYNLVRSHACGVGEPLALRSSCAASCC
jgi:hypothetical protein